MNKYFFEDSTRGGANYIALGVAVLFVLSNAYFGLHLLDDAFIHLRYAENLLSRHAVEFNVSEPSYGTSSPLFLYMVTLALSFGLTSIWIPKAISIIFYGLLLREIWRLYQLKQSTQGSVKYLLLACLFLLAMPMSARWLANGMETSLIGYLSLKLASLLTDDARTSSPISLGTTMLLALLTRVEYFALLPVVGLALMIYPSRKSKWAGLTAIGVAAIIAISQYLIVFGHISPDTALAKSDGFDLMRGLTSFAPTLMSVLGTHASSTTMGLAMLLMLGYLLFRVVHSKGRERVFLLGLSLAYAGLIYMIGARSQAIHGVRYFVFLVFFFLPFTTKDLHNSIVPKDITPKALKLKAWLSICLLILIADIFACWPVMYGRSITTLRFMSQQFDNTSGSNCIAYEVGYFSYFSGCKVYDMAGLVNGREVAKMNQDERIDRLKGIDYSLLFVNKPQKDTLIKHNVINADQFYVMATFDFPNVYSWISKDADTHYLLAKKTQPNLPDIDDKRQAPR